MSKAKNWRRRAEDEDDEEGAQGVLTSEKPPKPWLNKADKGKQKHAARPAGTKLLSFAEDDEDGANGPLSKKDKGKKSSSTLLSFRGDEGDAKAKRNGSFGTGHGSGHKVELGRDKGTSATVSNVCPQAGEYTPERLQELQRNTIRLGGSKPSLETKPPEPVVVLKGVLKPPADPDGNERDRHPEATAAVAGDGVSDMDFVMDVTKDDVGAGDTDAQIPDAAVIAAVKAKRERMRKAHAAPDYISLGTGEGEFRTKLREMPDIEALKKDEAISSDDDADDVQGRLAFLGEKKGGVFEFVDPISMDGRSLSLKDEDEEDEERKWEEEQLRKGAGKRVEEASSRASVVSIQGVPSNYVPNAQPSAGNPSRAQNTETLSVAQEADSAMLALQEGLKKLQESHARTKSSLNLTEQNLSASATTISSLEKNLSAAGEKYLYMQKLRDYVAALCEFLQTKGPLIEELEEHMQKLHEERADAVVQRRIADGSDEMAEVEAAVGAAMTVLNKGGSVQTAAAQAAAAAAAQAAAAAAAAAVSATEAASLAPQLDEFGRDMNLQKRTEKKLRDDARNRRLARGLAKRTARANVNGAATIDEKVEAESTSDESDSEERAYNSGRSDVLQTVGRIFSDASEEFSQLEMVKNRLEVWKRQYAAAYRDAYMPVSAPAIFSPYVRLELLKWDPLYDGTGFDNMEWYSLLFNYGMADGENELESDDPDSNLIPNLIEKVALPLLHHDLAYCWDQLSTRGTTNAVAGVQEILVYVPASSKALQDLLALVRLRLGEAVSRMEVPTWSLQVTAAVTQAARLAAYRFGTSIRLLRNISLWKDVLARPVLEQLALDDLLSAKILPHLRTLVPTLHDVVARTERVVAALGDAWVGLNVTELSPKLGGFVQHVNTLGRAVEKKRDAGIGTEDVVGLARRVKKMLVRLNEYERARELGKVFQLKEAL